MFLGYALLVANTVIVSTPIALPGKNGLHSPYHTVEWYASEFINLCEVIAREYNEYMGPDVPQASLSYF